MNISENRVKRNLLYACYFMFFILNLGLYYMQMVAFKGLYASDFPIHIDAAIKGSEDIYSILLYIFKMLYQIDMSTKYIAVFMAIVSMTTVYFTYLLLKYMLESENLYAMHIFAFICSFVMPIYLPFINSSFYKGGQSSVLWHNSTYIVMKCLGIYIIYFYLKNYELLRIKIMPVKLIAITLLLTLQTMVKPNFILCFAPAMLGFMLFDFLS